MSSKNILPFPFVRDRSGESHTHNVLDLRSASVTETPAANAGAYRMFRDNFVVGALNVIAGRLIVLPTSVAFMVSSHTYSLPHNRTNVKCF